jgi:hypothetical protein
VPLLFEPEDDWKAILPGQHLPGGLDIKLDFGPGGGKWARKLPAGHKASKAAGEREGGALIASAPRGAALYDPARAAAAVAPASAAAAEESSLLLLSEAAAARRSALRAAGVVQAARAHAAACRAVTAKTGAAGGGGGAEMEGDDEWLEAEASAAEAAEVAAEVE